MFIFGKKQIDTEYTEK